jgi:ribonucleoside-diphosphate reductase alpha chain
MSLFEELSAERKALQKDGKLPDWFTTIGWQAFKGKYLHGCATFEEQIDRIVNNIAKFYKVNNTDDTYTRAYMKGRWKEMLMKNHAYLATPPLSNNGTNRGLSVSCSGGVIGDSVWDFGDARTECSVLSQEGFGTSSYLGNIRPRGASISRGGTANGILPVFQDMVTMADNISQGGTRRGAWAGYVPMNHGDFDECVQEVKTSPDGSNIGWNVHDEDVERLQNGDPLITQRFQDSLHLKCLTGKGYYYFPDKVARLQPPMYEKLGLSSKASNLCTEITLHADEEHSYTCVLSGMVLTTYDEWKDTDAVFCMTVFLDCLLEEFLSLARNIKGMEKIVRGTEKGRAIGLGATGYQSP